MRLFLMADNWVGWKVTEYLAELNEEIVGLAVHPKDQQHFAREIIAAAGIPEADVVLGERHPSRDSIRRIKDSKPDIVLVIYWAFLLPREVYEIPPAGCINFHMAYLPFNRGKNPNVWPIIDGTPAGVTLHCIDSGTDSGPIVAQKHIDVAIVDTAKTLYDKQVLAFIDLFKEVWPQIRSHKLQPIAQEPGQGSFHLAKSFREIEEINLEREVKPMELINLLRAKTFPPYPPAYFMHEGKKVYVKIDLSYDF